ncbi:MAG: hypothetical protein KAG56_03580 [Sulfurovaceae bacterium]|nr:hypothetical protein [Sulfurovaceae bacterium]
MKNQEAKQVLTIGVGLMLLFHGIYKAMYGIDLFIVQLEGYRIPSAEYIAYTLLILANIIAPLLLLHGRFINIAGMIIVTHILIVINIIHIDHLLELNDYGTWRLETPILYLIAGLTFVLWEEDDCLI